MVRIYLIGIGILCIAILANGLAGWLGVKSWYELLNGLIEEGMEYIMSMGILDVVWLFIGYLMVLGAGGYWIVQLTTKWF